MTENHSNYEAPMPMMADPEPEGNTAASVGLAVQMLVQNGINTDASLAREKERHGNTRRGLWMASEENDQLRRSYKQACGQIADMHAAVYGGQARGPQRGVLEDVQDLYKRWEAAEEALGYRKRYVDEMEDRLELRDSEIRVRATMLQEAMSIIAGVSVLSGGWNTQEPSWIEQAKAWRDKWHELLGQDPNNQPVPAQVTPETDFGKRLRAAAMATPSNVHQLVKDAEFPPPASLAGMDNEMFKMAGESAFKDVPPRAECGQLVGDCEHNPDGGNHPMSTEAVLLADPVTYDEPPTVRTAEMRTERVPMPDRIIMPPRRRTVEQMKEVKPAWDEPVDADPLKGTGPHWVRPVRDNPQA